jgi:hypothetical protein
MGPGEVIVAVVGILWLSGALKTLTKRWVSQDRSALLGEVKALREEVRRLRQQHAEHVLSFDSTLHGLDHRVARLEGQGELGAGSASLPEGKISRPLVAGKP